MPPFGSNDDGKADFKAYYDMHSTPIYAFLRSMELCEEDAEDLLQDTFTKLWINRHRIQSKEHIKNWLYYVAGNAAINLLKSKEARYRNIEALQWMNEPAYFEIQRISSEWLSWIYLELERLPPGEGDVIRSLFIDGLTMHDIAERRNTSIKTVSNQRNDGLNKLRARLTKEQFAKLFMILMKLPM
jgi:RNA polymerase sigma factor (sigma-70 family)